MKNEKRGHELEKVLWTLDALSKFHQPILRSMKVIHGSAGRLVP